MNKYAIIEGNKVVNTVVAEPEYAAQKGWVELLGEAGIDWDYINGQFIDNRPKPPPPSEPTPPPTKEQLLAQLQALQTQIQALE